MYYLNYFFIFSLLGHLVESIIFKYFDWNLQSGFLYGYWTPIYGIGVVLIIIISRYIFKKLKLNKFLEVVIFTIIITLILTFIEFVGGNLLEIIFKREFWNYSDHKYHLGKYVSLDMAILWGSSSIIFLYLVKPWMDKIIKKIPRWITYTFVVLFIIDLIFTMLFKAIY